MKTLLHIAFLLSVCSVVAQSGLYHNGNMQVHNNANIGLHTDFINNANFNPATGLVGFYGNEVIQVSGNVSPTLWDTEIMSRSNVFFQIPVSVRNNVNFIDGNFLSPANNQAVYLNFMDQGFFTGESNESKVTGFAAVNNRDIFSFPVGDQAQLRPLTLLSQSTTPLAICAYFFENPSNPSSILESFDTDQKVNIATCGGIPNNDPFLFSFAPTYNNYGLHGGIWNRAQTAPNVPSNRNLRGNIAL